MGLAKQLGLVDQSGWPTQAGRRTTTVRGVVAGATEKVPLMNHFYELRGEHCQLHSSSSRQCLSESTVLLTVVDSVADSSRQCLSESKVLGLPKVCLRLHADHGLMWECTRAGKKMHVTVGVTNASLG